MLSSINDKVLQLKGKFFFCLRYKIVFFKSSIAQMLYFSNSNKVWLYILVSIYAWFIEVKILLLFKFTPNQFFYFYPYYHSFKPYLSKSYLLNYQEFDEKYFVKTYYFSLINRFFISFNGILPFIRTSIFSICQK